MEVDIDKICTTPARETDLAVKIVKNLRVSAGFWKLSFAKIAPGLRARAIRKSKSLKTDGLGTFFEVQSVFRVAGAGI